MVFKNLVCPTNTQQPNYSVEYTPTENSVWLTLLDINKKLPYQERGNLEISLPAKLESDFTEVIIPKSSNLTIGSIYKHPTFVINEFTNDIMPPLL